MSTPNPHPSNAAVPPTAEKTLPTLPIEPEEKPRAFLVDGVRGVGNILENEAHGIAEHWRNCEANQRQTSRDNRTLSLILTVATIALLFALWLLFSHAPQ